MIGSTESKVAWMGRVSEASERGLGLMVVMVVVLLLWTLTAKPASAATFTVDRMDDQPGTTPVFTPCTDAPNDCSLRWAIGESTSNGQTDTIDFAPGVRGTITLGAEQLAVANDSPAADLIIDGPGSGSLAVSGNNASRIFEMASGANATINGLTIRDGKVTGSPFGGGIYNGGDLTLNNTVVNSNTADSAGGGIYSSGTLTLTNSTVSANKSIATLGGGIFNNSGTLTLDNTGVSGNKANNGGGIRNAANATLSLTDSSIRGNNSNNDGGGVLNDGKATLKDSTVSGNSAAINGGGIDSGSDLTLTNSTVSGNTADDKGGGIANGGSLRSTNTTVSANIATGGDPDSAAGGIYNGGSSASLRNTIVARNSAPVAPDATGTAFTSEGNNLIGSTDGAAGFGASDLLDKNPVLGPLSDNGGPTKTQALLQGSPAIDRGTNIGCPPADQRGKARKDGDANGTVRCDIGAFEAANTEPAITNPKPAPGSNTRDRTPLIATTVRDAQTNLAKNNIKLFIDGNSKSAFSYDRSKDRLSYTSGRLSFGGHTVKIVAKEGVNTTNKSWSFKVVR